MAIAMKTQILHLCERMELLATVLLHTATAESPLMLRITTETRRGRTVLSVEGRVAGASVSILEECWRDLYAASPRQKFSVSLCGVSFIDNAGKVLLKEMHRHGADLLAEGCLNQAIVNEIVDSEKDTSRGAKSRKGSPIIFYIVLLGLVLSPAFARSQGNPALPGPAPADALRLPLEQAVALAIKQNPTQQIAVLNAAESVQDKNITRATLLPQADLRVADSANRVNLQAEFGGKPLVPGGQLPGHIGPYQIFSAGP